MGAGEEGEGSDGTGVDQSAHAGGGVVAGEEGAVGAAGQEGGEGELFVVGAPIPFGGVVVGEENVVEMNPDARRQGGEDMVEDPVDVASGHQDVARIDEHEIARGKLGEGPHAGLVHGCRDPFDIESGERRPGGRVDRCQAGRQAAVGDGPAQKAGGMAAADLDDARGP